MTGLEHLQTVALLDARYQLHECVGMGGTADVYRAEDMLLGRTVAIKLLRPESEVLASPMRVQREVSALATLHHPALVTLLDAHIDAGDARYLVMEFVEGPTLAAVLCDGPLPTAHVKHLAVELAAGLRAVHHAGLVHRDVKPSNILLAPASKPGVCFDVKLADFGLVLLTDSASVTTPGLVLGTGAYLAPEQVRGERTGPAADIYALGLVLLEALTGERAFGHASGIGAVMARLLEAPAVPETIDRQWAELIRRMTADDPAVRPTALDVAELVAELPADTTILAAPAVAPASEATRTAIMDARPTEPRTGRRPSQRSLHPVDPQRPRRPGIVAASLAAGVACALAIGTGFVMQGDRTDAGTLGTVEQVTPTVGPTDALDLSSLLPAVQAAATTETTPTGVASTPAPVAPAATQTHVRQSQVSQQGATSRGKQGPGHSGPPAHGPKGGK